MDTFIYNSTSNLKVAAVISLMLCRWYFFCYVFKTKTVSKPLVKNQPDLCKINTQKENFKNIFDFGAGLLQTYYAE